MLAEPRPQRLVIFARKDNLCAFASRFAALTCTTYRAQLPERAMIDETGPWNSGDDGERLIAIAWIIRRQTVPMSRLRFLSIRRKL
jgi:hypothetical protein